MAASAGYPYPVLVEGDWTLEIAKVLKTKLQVYFQSKKKSNGGDCFVEFGDLSEKQVVVWFACQQTRCQVLEKETHEIDLQKRGKIHLTVKTLPQADWDSTTAPQLTPGQSDQDTVRKLHETKTGSQAVLKQEAHSEDTDQLTRRLHEDKDEDPAQSSAVVLQNLPKDSTCEMLNLLIENFTGLTEETGHFSLEILNEMDVAVVVFKTNIDINDFIEKCSRKALSNNQNIMARQLEITTSVRVENLPSNISNQFLKLYFESSRNGCGEVTDIEMMSEDDVAIVSFGDSNVLDTILAKTHVIEKTPIYVYPYYKSLGSALYGKKRPYVKMPDPFTFTLDPYIFQFLQKDRRRIAEIKDKMSVHHCNIALLDTDLSNSIKISPTFSGQETSLKKLVKNWKQLASDNLTGILSKYKTINNSVRQHTWEKIQGDFKQHLNQNIVVIPAISNEQVIVAGESESVDIFQQEFKSLVDRVTEELEREKQSVTKKVSCDPAKCNFLLSTGLEKCVSTIFPDITMECNASAGDITLYGLPKDVFAAKSKILEELVQIKTKKLDMNPHLIYFLQKLDSNEVSCCLFISNGINAMYDIQDNCVLLIGVKDSFLRAAEEQIKKCLNFKSIKVEDSRVIAMPEWAQLKQNLITKLNSPVIQVEIKVMPLDEHLEIIISGYSSAVMDVFEMLSDFVMKNTIIQKQVSLKSAGVLQFLMDIRKLDLLHTAPKDVKIQVDVVENGSSVLLSGPQVYVLQMENDLLNEAATVISSVLEIAKPGTKKIFKEKEDMYVSTLMHRFNCILKMIESGNFGDSAKLGQSHYKVQLPGGPLVTVYRGDLCKSEVDVIVNAANESLQHIGGLAADLLKAAGSTLQTQCNWIVKDQGSLVPGDAVITSAGKLPCSRVIHAVGPRWMEADADTSKKCLRKAIIQSLTLAEAHNLKTIAIPAISSGIFGFPLNLCAEVIVRSIREHCVNSQGGSALKAIHLVNHDEQTVCAISVAAQKILGEFALTGPTPTQPKRLNSGSKINIRSMNCVHEAQTKEGLNLFVLKGRIQDVATDIIVNVIGMDFDLSSGTLSKELLKKAGPNLQQSLFHEKNSKKHAVGKIIETKGFNLNCTEVFHVIAPLWDEGKGDAKKMLKNIIKDCLKNTEALQLTSIAFPAIGTGKLCFPKDLVANLMIENTIKFSSKANAMSREFKRTFNPQQKMTQRPSGNFFGTVSSPAADHVEVQIGPILLQVVTGDITNEQTDVIVNSSNSNFTLRAGVSKAILDSAGQTVEDECKALGSQPNTGLITTNPGNLQCKKIIHMVGQTDPNQMRAFIGAVLQKCEDNKLSSVAFPALGTGQGRVNPSQVADAMIDSVCDFVNRKSSTYLQKIRIVIFQPQMFSEFQNSLQRRERSNLPESESLWNRAKNAVTGLIWTDQSKEKKQHFIENHIIFKDQIDPVLFEICGGSELIVQKAKSFIQCLILKEQDEKIIYSDYLFQLSEKEEEELTALQKKLQITIELKFKLSKAEAIIRGAAKDVSSAYSKIQEMINNLRAEESKRRDEELLNNLVQWYFEQGTQLTPFDKSVNLDLEKAFSQFKTELFIDWQSKKWRVDFKQNTAVDTQGNIICLKRALKTEGLATDNIPSHWDDMQKSQYKFIPLQQQSQEYQEVVKSITASQNLMRLNKPIKIVKIERLQNMCLWKNYMIKKQQLEDKNPAGTTNEHVLFHGTAQDTLDSINHHGFNRSYAGRNATALGKGTYFAVNASYSYQETYSRTDAHGFKHIYRARVLTGVSCRGQPGMITPPSKSSTNPTDLYDSVVDDEQNPTMFVIFNDIQAYPEYLITFAS
ncbi:protein mono-ADP-ribosyltransferase PARP14-like isoform X2 [Stegostoma tigrinum]|uniref:protein mono-ADP-ribosyltransferase PARP14-like isoform X2 n=1 Tax=Stegostoma tigrinum TaxID=3053191 RepID=UPI002870976D|nr:protein mono-ADP-ribosyltransferase PARP14-like isoform X2 [Stegostoma tigrinum]